MGKRIEEEEKTLQYLEELDSNYSKIKRTLKEIEIKLNTIFKRNKKVIEDYNPLIFFFKSNTLQQEDLNSSIIMKSGGPKNPFYDETTILQNNSNVLKTNANESSSMDDVKVYSDCYIDDSTSTSIADFDINRIPQIFQNEHDLFEIYNFILEKKSVSYDELVNCFVQVDYDKMTIYLDLLKNKKFIRKKGDMFFIE